MLLYTNEDKDNLVTKWVIKGKPQKMLYYKANTANALHSKPQLTIRCKPLKLLKPFKKQKYTWNWTRDIETGSSVTEDKKGTTKGPEVQQPSKTIWQHRQASFKSIFSTEFSQENYFKVWFYPTVGQVKMSVQLWPGRRHTCCLNNMYVCGNSWAEISALAGIKWTSVHWSQVQQETTLKRPSVHRFATTMLNASCATMSVLLKKKEMTEYELK